MDLGSQGVKLVDRHEVYEDDDEWKDDLFDNEIFDTYVSPKESWGGLIQDYKTLSDVVNLMEDNTKTVVEAAWRGTVTDNVGETIEKEFRVNLVEQEEWMKTWLTNMMGKFLIDIVDYGRLHRPLGSNFNQLAK